MDDKSLVCCDDNPSLLSLFSYTRANLSFHLQRASSENIHVIVTYLKVTKKKQNNCHLSVKKGRRELGGGGWGMGGQGWTMCSIRSISHFIQAQGHIEPGNQRVESCVTALLTSSMANIMSLCRSMATTEKRLQLVGLEKAVHKLERKPAIVQTRDVKAIITP